ncbi:MAG: alpha-amylase family glycosyl hydrolase [Myxococcota bacterium]|jgi:glycosidase|nr:alpha-amylase family glycosyl hydrolase [Myxococcota bacterium]
MTLRFAPLLLLAALILSACVEAEPLPVGPLQANVKLSTHVQDWRDEVIYQVLIDRFNDGDKNNNFNVDPRIMGKYHGGDWEGLIEKLDYLQALGVTAVWISPVVKNVEEDAGFASYHGYWTQHFTEHNPHFGDLSTLRRLSDELHSRNMKLILDIVTNHVGQAFFYDMNMNGQADDWLQGSGDPAAGSGISEGRPLSRISEYDPDYDVRGIQSFTSLGLAGPAPAVFLYMPQINRVPPGPSPMDLNNDGVISGIDEELGFANPDWYHRRGRVVSWDAPNTGPYTHTFGGLPLDPPAKPGQAERIYYQNDQTLFGDFPGGLKDLATENPAVRKALIQAFTYWIDVSNADGFRIDTLKHVEYSFWEEFAPAMRQHAARRGKTNFLMFGEAFDGNDDLLGAYTRLDQVDSVFFFSQKYAIDNVFKCPPGNSAPSCNGRSNGTSDIYGWGGENPRLDKFSTTPQPGGVTDAAGNGVAPRQLLVSFLDNHDVARFLFDRSDANGITALKAALFYLLTTHGIPCIYYGTEQGFFGGNDPSNREDMWKQDSSIYAKYNFGYAYRPWNTDNPIFQHISKLISMRKKYLPLRQGNFEFIWHSTRTGNERDAGILAFERVAGEQRVVVVINSHETQSSSTRAPDSEGGATMSTGFAQGTVLVDAFNPNDRFTVGAGGSLEVSVPPSSGRILMPEGML